MMMNDLMVYLKTTDTCQLDCEHCFTNGRNGKKGWFDVPKVIDFFTRLKQFNPNINSGHISFHGGEPMLAPTELLWEAYNGIKDLWPEVWWGVQTNLTYKLTDGQLEVFEKICNKTIGTSWDKDIRWLGNINQELMWEHNVRTLADKGYHITVMVCVTKSVVEMEPKKIIQKMIDLGVKYINFERVTANGSAVTNIDSVMPTNKELDAWFLKMYNQTKDNELYKYIDNMFFHSLMTQLVHKTHSGCRCRQCEQKILTINADGSVGGCPNGAVETQFGNIEQDVQELLSSEGRMCNIQSETIRHPKCSICPVFDLCNGDCHQLGWQDDICAAPKSLMKQLKVDDDVELYKQFLNGFVGQE